MELTERNTNIWETLRWQPEILAAQHFISIWWVLLTVVLPHASGITRHLYWVCLWVSEFLLVEKADYSLPFRYEIWEIAQTPRRNLLLYAVYLPSKTLTTSRYSLRLGIEMGCLPSQRAQWILTQHNPQFYLRCFVRHEHTANNKMKECYHSELKPLS